MHKITKLWFSSSYEVWLTKRMKMTCSIFLSWNASSRDGSDLLIIHVLHELLCHKRMSCARHRIMGGEKAHFSNRRSCCCIHARIGLRWKSKKILLISPPSIRQYVLNISFFYRSVCSGPCYRRWWRNGFSSNHDLSEEIGSHRWSSFQQWKSSRAQVNLHRWQQKPAYWECGSELPWTYLSIRRDYCSCLSLGKWSEHSHWSHPLHDEP